jgi:TRAP-type C4-dicarboxylate transport system substrate-binding protein
VEWQELTSEDRSALASLWEERVVWGALKRLLDQQRNRHLESLKQEVEVTRLYRAQGAVEALDAFYLKLEQISKEGNENG